MRKAVKALLSKNLFLPLVSSRRFIFVYHDVSNKTESHFSAEHYSTTVENFRKQINFLSQNFETVSLENLVSNVSLDNKKHYASIVFDDGFSSIIKNALPILRKYKIPFSIFVNKSAVIHDQNWISNLIIYQDNKNYLRKIYEHSLSQKISFSEFVAKPIENLLRFQIFDEDFQQLYLREYGVRINKVYLNANEIQQFHNEGILIGSHSTDHYLLSNCNDKELHIQISENKDFLEDLLKKKIEHFAIPFGKNNSYNSITIKSIFASGSKFVYSTNPIPFKTQDALNNDFLFPRIGILNQQPDEIMFYINRTFIKNYNL